jgi:hypothetical protein
MCFKFRMPASSCSLVTNIRPKKVFKQAPWYHVTSTERSLKNCIFRSLILEVGSTSETSVNIYQTASRNIPEDSHLHCHRCENLKKKHQKWQDLLFLCEVVWKVHYWFKIYQALYTDKNGEIDSSFDRRIYICIYCITCCPFWQNSVLLQQDLIIMYGIHNSGLANGCADWELDGYLLFCDCAAFYLCLRPWKHKNLSNVGY